MKLFRFKYQSVFIFLTILTLISSFYSFTNKGQNNISAKVWSNTALQSRKCYMGPYNPSEALDEWHPNIPLEYLKTDPEREHSEQGYANFVHIELKIVELDVLEYVFFIIPIGPD